MIGFYSLLNLEFMAASSIAEIKKNALLSISLISQTGLLILSAIDRVARTFLPPYAVVCSERDVSLVIRTHISRVAPDWDL